MLGADGTIDTIEGTTIHPIWSLGAGDWVPLGELEEGEQLLSATGPATILAHQVLHRTTPVYNIEIHGEHVYQAGALGILVHNAADDCIAALRAGNSYKIVSELSEATVKLSDDALEVTGAYIDDGFLVLVDNIRSAASATGAKGILLRDVGFGFGTITGKAAKIKRFFETAGKLTKTQDTFLGPLYDIFIRI